MFIYTTTATNYSLHSPRNTRSLIQQMTVNCNGVQLANINDYNLLFNTLYDVEGADNSQTSKRLLENPDPSVYYHQGISTSNNTPTGVSTLKMVLQTYRKWSPNCNQQFYWDNFFLKHPRFGPEFC
jgi:hypothetical protein